MIVCVSGEPEHYITFILGCTCLSCVTSWWLCVFLECLSIISLSFWDVLVSRVWHHDDCVCFWSAWALYHFHSGTYLSLVCDITMIVCVSGVPEHYISFILGCTCLSCVSSRWLCVFLERLSIISLSFWDLPLVCVITMIVCVSGEPEHYITFILGCTCLSCVLKQLTTFGRCPLRCWTSTSGNTAITVVLDEWSTCLCAGTQHCMVMLQALTGDVPSRCHYHYHYLLLLKSSDSSDTITWQFRGHLTKLTVLHVSHWQFHCQLAGTAPDFCQPNDNILLLILSGLLVDLSAMCSTEHTGCWLRLVFRRPVPLCHFHYSAII